MASSSRGSSAGGESAGAASRVTLVFDSSTAALWAEEVADDAGIPVDVVPAPAGSAAKCDLALETTPRRLKRLEEELKAQGVPYRRWEWES